MITATVVAALFVLVLLTCRRDVLAAVTGTTIITATMLVPTFYVSEAVVKNGVLLVAAVATLLTLLRRRLDTERHRGAWLLGAYIALTAAATVLHPLSGQLSELLTAALPGACLLVVWLVSSTGERQFLAKFMVFLASAEALYAVLQMLGVVPRLWGNSVLYPHQLLAGLTRGEGTMGHPLMLALLLLFAVALVLSKQIQFTGLERAGIFLVLAIGLFATGSRSGLIVAVVLLIFSLGGTRTLRFILGASSAVLLVTVLAATGFFTGNLVTSFLEGDSVGHRTGAIDAIPKLLAQQPVDVIMGNGAGSVDDLFAQGLLQAGNFFAIDNQLVTTIVTTGLLGLVVLVALVVVGICTRGGMRKPLIAVAVFFFTFDVLAWPAGFALFALSVGMCLTEQRVRSSPSLENKRAHTPARPRT